MGIVACFLSAHLVSQEKQLDVSHESHHTLILQNSKVGVYLLQLAVGEATAPHEHPGPYAFIALSPVVLDNETKGRPPRRTALEFGELRSSKGGFRVAERNVGQEPLRIAVVDPHTVSQHQDGFATDPVNYKYHDAAVGTLFEDNEWRAYELDIASGGRTEKHKQHYDQLLVALSDLQLQDSVEAKGTSDLNLQLGQTAWVPAGDIHSLTNMGKNPARFIVFEFR